MIFMGAVLPHCEGVRHGVGRGEGRDRTLCISPPRKMGMYLTSQLAKTGSCWGIMLAVFELPPRARDSCQSQGWTEALTRRI